jgi:hypothetical protein
MHTEHLKKNFSNWTEFSAEPEQYPQRSDAILKTAVLEDLIDSYLRVYFSNFEEEHENIFGHTSPTGTFVAKTRLCYVLRLISNKEFVALKAIAKVRNEFAHNPCSSFSSDNVKKHVRNLKDAVKISDDDTQPAMAEISEKYHSFVDPRFVFLLATGKLSTDLLLRLDDIADHTRNGHATEDFTSSVATK